MSGAAHAQSGGDDEAEGDGPLRRCIVTRAELSQDDMIRFVLAPDGAPVPDLARRLPGRGAWVTARRDVVAEAVRISAFAKSFKRPVRAAGDLPDQIERLLVRRLGETLSLANKAGLVVAGFAKVEAVITSGRAKVLFHARDGAEDGIRKLDHRLHAIGGDDIPAIRELDIHDLSLALGRENVVHAALEDGGATRRVLAEALRLRHYRTA